MIVTVMSDASLCPNTGAAGWGVWIKSNRGNFQGAGNYKKGVRCCTKAEAMALFNAVFIAFRTGLAQKGDVLILQTDNLYTVQALNSTYHDSNRHIKEIAGKLDKMIARHESTFEARHVKAHAPHLGRRNFVNEICDGLAKGAMRKQRTALKAAA